MWGGRRAALGRLTLAPLALHAAVAPAKTRDAVADAAPLGIDVTTMGADPTGTADSAKALDRACATGRALLFPRGSYRVSSPIDASHSGPWRGEGAALTRLVSPPTRSEHPLFVLPDHVSGLSFHGEGGLGLVCGGTGRFRAFGTWADVEVRGYSVGIRVGNLYAYRWQNVRAQYCWVGVDIAPQRYTGDGGYVTTFTWDTVYLGFNESLGLRVVLQELSPFLHWHNVVIERNGEHDPDAPAQAMMERCQLRAEGLYCEGTPAAPRIALQIGDRCDAVIRSAYLRGTRGIRLRDRASLVLEDAIQSTPADGVIDHQGLASQRLELVRSPDATWPAPRQLRLRVQPPAGPVERP